MRRILRGIPVLSIANLLRFVRYFAGDEPARSFQRTGRPASSSLSESAVEAVDVTECIAMFLEGNDKSLQVYGSVVVILKHLVIISSISMFCFANFPYENRWSISLTRCSTVWTGLPFASCTHSWSQP
jgi:hypothetical protein